MSIRTWSRSPVLGVANVRRTTESCRDALGFSLDPIDGVSQHSPDEPDCVYAFVEHAGVWIYFQTRRGERTVRQRLARGEFHR